MSQVRYRVAQVGHVPGHGAGVASWQVTALVGLVVKEEVGLAFSARQLAWLAFAHFGTIKKSGNVLSLLCSFADLRGATKVFALWSFCQWQCERGQQVICFAGSLLRIVPGSAGRASMRWSPQRALAPPA